MRFKVLVPRLGAESLGLTEFASRLCKGLGFRV